MSAPTALYRRYRPDSFATVIGQEHVTAPLMTALDKDRVNHAYLFSGPRGCGKTTSARILARCLNCAKGPTAHPCGECDSCVELARGGAGSLDVIEIDAASHGGVDDARDLRERATFAPIRDRYKIFIIDEAHMVTSAGFNALLKIVEEPPEHIKFIFATTEPDKVIGTIRSRTHHYPFRLVPPEPLMAYLAQLCEQENVAVAPGVLSLVVRAGGGSVRDSLSVLDQLMAGAGAAGLDYDLAVDLLGYTHSSLLDDVVEALAASDSGTVFKSVDRVIQTGHDPRRFVEDLLERFRDLIIVQAMPESAHAILRGTPDELIARMQTQAAQLGAAELSRAADVTNAAFNEMTGATSPRLHLELLGARLLLPGADSSARGMATRLDQLERRLNYGGAPAGNGPAAAAQGHAPEQGFPTERTTAAPAYAVTGSSDAGTSGGEPSSPDNSSGGLAAVRAQLARAKEAAGAEVAARHAPDAAQPPAPTQAPGSVPAEAPAPAPAPAQSRTWDELPTPAGTPDFESPQESEQIPATTREAAPSQPAQPARPQPAQAAAPAQGETVAAAAAGVGSTGIEVIRRAWPEILGSLRSIRMASWVIVNQNVVPQTFDGRELRVGLPSTGLISTFTNSGHLENLQQAINQVLGMTVQILPVDGEAPSPRASSEPNPKVPTGNPSPQRGGGGGNAPRPVNDGYPRRQQTADPVASPVEAQHAGKPQQAPGPTSAPAQAQQDSWGLPSNAPNVAAATPAAQSSATPAETVASPNPVADPIQPEPGAPKAQQLRPATPAPVVAPAAVAPAAARQAAAGHAAAAEQAITEQAPWDGPTEPSDPWDEPHPDSYPPDDYQPESHAPAEPNESASSLDGGAYPDAGQHRAAGQDRSAGQPLPAGQHHRDPSRSAAPYPPAHPERLAAPKSSQPLVEQAPTPAPAYTPPKVSPIAAWTTGWDLPAAVPVAAAAAEAEAPRRSAMLAEQIAQSGRQSNEPAPQDWGVSLGQANRQNVADPGWGSMSNAPDWAQENGSSADTSEAAQKTPTASPAAPNASSATSPAETSAPEPATPAAKAETQPPFNAALPVGGSPLGASSTYPTVSTASIPVAQALETAQRQETPTSDMAADNPAQGAEKLSMYQRLANSPAAQAARAHAPAANTPLVEDVPGPDDVTIEESGVVGQAAVERILGGVLIEERPLNPIN